LILACIIDLRARPGRRPAVNQEKQKHTFFSFQTISDFVN
jgi:hypothetical protein